ncbi:MAG: hypothetical protein Q9175_003102 [Cornicularia normoerica]
MWRHELMVGVLVGVIVREARGLEDDDDEGQGEQVHKPINPTSISAPTAISNHRTAALKPSVPTLKTHKATHLTSTITAKKRKPAADDEPYGRRLNHVMWTPPCLTRRT